MKIKSIKLDKYFELVKPKYVYIKITPDKSIRNYNSSNIAKAIANTYKLTHNRIKVEQKKLFFETSFKISYIIDITRENVNFYFLVPQTFVTIIVEKIREIWKKATIEIKETSEVNNFSSNAIGYQLTYKKEDPLSLYVDKTSNEPLNSLLNIVEIMKDSDRVSIVYNFIPMSHADWLKRYEATMDNIKRNKILTRERFSIKFIFKFALLNLFNLAFSIRDVLNDFLGGDTIENLAFLESVTDMINQNNANKISNSTRRKKTLTMLETQILVISDGNNKTSQVNNATSVCESYSILDDDNKLIYKEIKKIPNILDTKFKKIDTNTFSTDECQNFIQIPGRTLLKDFKIDHIKTLENPVPGELQNGVKYLGNVKYKEKKYKSYLENEYNVGNLPLVLIGSQGSGKTTYMSNYCSYCEKANESVVVIDFIKNCELSTDIKKVIPKEKIVEIDLGTEQGIQGLGYNEIQIKDNMSDFEKLKLANLQSQQIMSLVDAISVGDPLSSRMRRFLNSAANIVFVLGYNSVKSVIDCLEKYEKRQMYVNNLSDGLKAMLEDELSTLAELDEWSKTTKDNPISEVIGTKSSKVEHILDRIGLLREDFKLKYMYNKSLDNNINLVDCMEKGKIVFIKMNENDFPTAMIKNIMVTYWVSKIWLASQIRGGLHEKPTRTNIVIDEIFQAPTCMNTLDYILPQSRKFGCKFIFSTQYIKQLDKIFNSLEASGSSYMLLRGCTENDFDHFKTKLNEFEYEDIMDMEEFSSLNLIYYSKGYSSFISKMPKPIKG